MLRHNFVCGDVIDLHR